MRKAHVRQPTETRQTEIVEAVLSLAARVDPVNITTADIASELKLTQGAVFKHFPSKEAIWLAVLDWVETHLFSALEAAARREDTPLDGLGAIFMTHVKFILSRPGVPRLIFQHLQQPEDTSLKARVRGLMERYRKLLTTLLAEAEKQGQIPKAQDKAAAAMLFIGAIQGLAIQSMLNTNPTKMAEITKHMLKLYLQAIREQP